MAFHGRSHDALFRLRLRLGDHAVAKRELEQDPEDGGHQEATRKLSADELPAEEDEQHQPQLEHEVGRCELENDRVDERSALAKQAAGQRHRRVGAARAGGAESARKQESPRV